MELSGEKRIWGAQIARGWALRTPQWGRELGKPCTPGRERIARWPVGKACCPWVVRGLF